MTSVGSGVREIRVRDEAGILRMIYLATRRRLRIALLPEEDSMNESFGYGTGDEAI
jgi:hypothetical protein